ncbi:transcriptional regulator [Clostridium carboxidivorans P7]|uniref:Stage 0 sporulation protein A homolog n=1 Tax=Clostridium carboxidivorans P7 TaxID=536227 RepID=C6PX17_9CLOT|nr:response regulator transcription factor [Clostridium carboxidivorans]AKN31161.1 transcriptional regulator [Clostridium carboxidivorans P7]EET86194.1 two component transcriptional regulator, winged helix family [Clostridium carboxidivorans P7]EFG88272.1 response regulator receiver domain protein [Clostridium carboxidivorans P7]
MKKILVVEDEIDIQNIIKAFLEDACYEVDTSNDGIEGFEKFKLSTYDLIILDIMLPKISGFAVCEMIRKESHVPIIILTALDDDQNQIKGFDLMADDYISKPFSPQILLKRVEAVLRRFNESFANLDNTVVAYKDIKLDKNAAKAFVASKELELTAKEFELLNMLIENKGIVLTREVILNKLWGYDFYGDERVVDTHIKNLRRKLGVDYIQTIRKVGYKLEGN